MVLYVSGLVKFVLARTKLRKNRVRWMASSMRHCLRSRKGLTHFIGFSLKMYPQFKYNPFTVASLRVFATNIWNAIFFITSQTNLNLSFNFLYVDIVEIFYFQLYFVLDKMMIFYREIFRSFMCRKYKISHFKKVKLWKKTLSNLSKRSLLKPNNSSLSNYASKAIFTF